MTERLRDSGQEIVTAPLEAQCRELWDQLRETTGKLEDILGPFAAATVAKSKEELPSQGSLDRVGAVITHCRTEANFILKQVTAIRNRLAE